MDDSNDKERLKASRQRKILDRLVAELAGSDSRVYYLSTVEIAQRIETTLKTGAAGLTEAEKDLLSGLRARDIQILLSIHPT
ncbi:MAG: hypothetical protein AAGI27_05950 [Pseudomonadota bacterium]